MAFQILVAGEFFYKVLAGLQVIEQEHGPLALAFLESTQLSPSRTWELTLAAPWLDNLGLREASSLVTQAVRAELGQAEAFSGTHIRRMDDYLVRHLLAAVEIPSLGMPYRVEGAELDQFELQDTVVFVANRYVQTAAPNHKISA